MITFAAPLTIAAASTFVSTFAVAPTSVVTLTLAACCPIVQELEQEQDVAGWWGGRMGWMELKLELEWGLELGGGGRAGWRRWIKRGLELDGGAG